MRLSVVFLFSIFSAPATKAFLNSWTMQCSLSRSDIKILYDEYKAFLSDESGEAAAGSGGVSEVTLICA